MSYVTIRHWLDLLKRLPPAGAILHASSLRSLAGLDEKTGRQACWRLARAGVLTHLGRGWYTHALARPSLAEAAHLLVIPSYVSLETVLTAREVTTQRSPTHQCVTRKPPQRLSTPLGDIRYRHLSAELFFGFNRRTGPSGLPYFEADPEKALLDLVYLSQRGGEPVWLDLDFSQLDAARLERYAARFPAAVRARLDDLRLTRVVDS